MFNLQCLSPENIKKAINQSNQFNLNQKKVEENRIKQFQQLLNSYLQSKSPNKTSRKSLNIPRKEIKTDSIISRLVGSVTPQKSDATRSSGVIRISKQNTDHKDQASDIQQQQNNQQLNIELQFIQQKVKDKLKKYEEEKRQYQQEKQSMLKRIAELESELEQYRQKEEQKRIALDQSFG